MRRQRHSHSPGIAAFAVPSVSRPTALVRSPGPSDEPAASTGYVRTAARRRLRRSTIACPYCRTPKGHEVDDAHAADCARQRADVSASRDDAARRGPVPQPPSTSACNEPALKRRTSCGQPHPGHPPRPHASRSSSGTSTIVEPTSHSLVSAKGPSVKTNSPLVASALPPPRAPRPVHRVDQDALVLHLWDDGLDASTRPSNHASSWSPTTAG